MKRFMYICLCVCLISSLHAYAQTDVPFSSDSWNIVFGETTEYLGRECFTGRALLPEVVFENGIIECDVACDGARAFVGLSFRVEDRDNYEEFYLRPHKTQQVDALQYTPVINGQSGWQLYNGEGFTAAAAIPHNEWIHVKIEVSGTRARVFLDHGQEPALEINELKRGITQGGIGVSASGRKLGFYSNFSYQLIDDIVLPPVPEQPPAIGMIKDWDLSQPFSVYDVDYQNYPDAGLLENLEWQEASPEADGLINIARTHRKPNPGPSVAFAKTILHADKSTTIEVTFGYSDIMLLYLNGTQMYVGQNSFRSRDPGYLGAVGLFDTVFLPLKKGDNEILLTVIDSFGGWGFIAQNSSHVILEEGLRQTWQISQKPQNPESALYDPKRNILYVSNYGLYRRPGQNTLSKVTLEGTIEELDWVTGLTRPLGEVIYEDKLYVVEKRSLTEIELPSGKILNRYGFPDPVFPNDVAVDKYGNFYISDTERHVLYRLSEGKMEVWLEGEEVLNPNGMLVRDNLLIWGNIGTGDLKSIDTNTREVKTIAHFNPPDIDGIRLDENGDILLSLYTGCIYRVTPKGEKTLLINTMARGMPLADFEYLPEKRMFVVPTLFDNRVVSFQHE